MIKEKKINGFDYQIMGGISAVLVPHSENVASLVANDLSPLMLVSGVISYNLTGMAPTVLRFYRSSDDSEKKIVGVVYLKSDTCGNIPLNEVFFDSVEVDTNYNSDNITIYVSGLELKTRYNAELSNVKEVNNLPFVASGIEFKKDEDNQFTHHQSNTHSFIIESIQSQSFKRNVSFGVGGSWARELADFINTESANAHFRIGVRGSNDIYGYNYMGFGGNASDINLRIYPDGLVTGKSFKGKFKAADNSVGITETIDPTTHKVIVKNGIIVGKKAI